MKEIRVTRSFVAADALAEVIDEAYEFEEPVACKLFSKMLRSQDNDHYQVKVGDKKYVARVYQFGPHLRRDESDYQYELDWLDFLHTEGIPVSHPIVRRDGSFLGQLNAPEGPRYLALFSFAEGKQMSAEDEEQLYILGQSMARIHLVSNKYESPFRRRPMDLTYLVDEPAERLKALWENNRDEKLDILLTSAEEAKAEIQALIDNEEETADGWGPICGDFHHLNTHFDARNEPSFFNFDLCGPGWRSYDIATFLLNTGLLHKSSKLSEAFFAGYYSVRPLSINEHEAVSPFLTIRRIWLTGTFSVLDGMVGHTFVATI